MMEIRKTLVFTLAVGTILTMPHSVIAEPATEAAPANHASGAAASQPKSKAQSKAASQPGKAKSPRSKARITEAEALKIVTNRPEVKEWKIGIAKASKPGRKLTAQIDVDRKEAGSYVVHAYEVVPDDAETSHTATFNWYHVNERTGAVSKEF